MIKVLAIDDEPLALQQLASYIKKIPFLEEYDFSLLSTDEVFSWDLFIMLLLSSNGD